jgi:serine-type D-Ala-D-Ala carboxypeptidase
MEIRIEKLPAPGTGRTPVLRTGAAVLLFGLLLHLAVALFPARPRAPELAGPPDPALARIPAESVEGARAVVLAELERRAFPGAALVAGVGPNPQWTEGFGAIGWRPAAAAVSPDTTVYDLASLTKLVATATAVLLLVEEGKIDLDAPVQRTLPEFEGVYKERVTWRHLLTHTSGLPAGTVVRGSTPEERSRRLLRTLIRVPPGSQIHYSDIGYIVLWQAAERAAGEPLPDYLERRVFRPLGMHRTTFSPGQECTACAPTLLLTTGVPYRGRPHDPTARLLGGVTGNAGLFATAADVARYTAMLANGGELDGVRILSRASVDALFTQQPRAGRRTLGGVALCPEEPDEGLYELRGACRRPLAVGHNGFTGTSIWIDPETKAWVVLLTNRTYDQRAPEQMRDLRIETIRAVAQSLRGDLHPTPPAGSRARSSR